ncbi:hypothetical protein Aperf_G00000070410 [Anoplocephala perfoliata]
MSLELSDGEEIMLKRLAALEGPHFRHQTRDETPLTQEEKVQIASELLRRNPGEFLARYHRFLHWPDDAVCFSGLWNDYTVCYYLKDVVGLLPPPSRPAQISPSGDPSTQDYFRRKRDLQIKNRRLVAMRRMEAEASADPTEGFFSHEAMRERDPVLWERMVGRHLTNTERRSLLGHQYESFSGMLLSQLLESEQMSERQPHDTEGEEEEEDENEPDEDDMVDRDRWRSKKNEASVRRDRALQEFREMMHSRFLAGQDSSFNYDAIDNDVTLDDEMEERGRDAEDTYFDSESPCAAPPIEEAIDSPNPHQM